MYAQLCKRLSKEAPNFEPKDSNCTFLRLLLNVCHNKFLNRSTYTDNVTHDGPLTPEEEEKKYVAKQKMLGNVKFIGELCKLDMLSDKILHMCIQRLLENTGSKATTIQDRCENMECLCQLVRTCGKNMDTVQGKALMDQYFDKMAGCANNPKYPPRIRFMLRDVIEMRNNNWVPRKVNTTEGPVPIHQLKSDEDIMRPGYINRNRDPRNNDREPDSWMNRLPLNLQPGFNDMLFSSLSVSSPTPTIPPYNSQNNFSNRDHRNDGFRHNQRNNQTHNNYNNRYNKHNNQNNFISHNNSFTNNMLNNKDLAPRFKRTLIAPNQDSVENLQMRPAANSLLFKANMNVKVTLPLSQPKANNNISIETANTTSIINTIKISPATPSNNLLHKEQILIKQASLEKPQKQNKKGKGPSKDEVLKKVSIFVSETLLCNTNSNDNMTELIASFLELKVPDKFIKDSIILILYEMLEKNDVVYERIIEFLLNLKKDNKLHGNAILESFKTVINGMNEREVTIPRITTLVASLLSRAVSSKLCSLSEISSYTENGLHYPLFLLILQQLHKNLGKLALLEIFNESKINLMLSLPEADRTKDRMAEILEDRNLSFLYPLLKVQAELWKQIQVDPNPHQFYKWIKENVEANCLTDHGFITAMMTVVLKYITQETTLAIGIDPSKNPEKTLIEQEKALLEKYCPVLNAFMNLNSDLQLIAIYALQVFCYSVNFPKGMLLRWFTALYELNVIEEESFLRWKEDITDVYPGKGKALFQVNTWLLWLKEAEDEEDEE